MYTVFAGIDTRYEVFGTAHGHSPEGRLDIYDANHRTVASFAAGKWLAFTYVDAEKGDTNQSV